MPEHGVSHVGHGVAVLGIQLADEQVDDGEHVWHHHREALHHANAPHGDGDEEVDAAHGGDEAVDVDVGHAVVDQPRVFP